MDITRSSIQVIFLGLVFMNLKKNVFNFLENEPTQEGDRMQFWRFILRKLQNRTVNGKTICSF